jgi:hypothetical protein
MRSRIWVAAVVLTQLVFIGACAGRPSGSVPASTAGSGAESPGLPQPTASVDLPSPSLAPPTDAASPSTRPGPTLEPPPNATILVGGDVYRGEVGSYSWKASGQDAPWLPADALESVPVGARESLRVTMKDVAIESWTARLAPAAEKDGLPATALGEGTGPIAFSGPSSGNWVILVTIQFADSLGSGAYYWLIEVR